MAKRENPRHGSMQFWPRKRAKNETPRIRAWQKLSESKILGFAGYKVGMTHALITDNRKTSPTKGMDIFMPLTIIECPPLKVIGVRYYAHGEEVNVVSQVFAEKLDKELSRKISIPKKKKGNTPEKFDDLTLLVSTQPKNTTLPKKKPEVFEIAISGNKEDKIKLAKEKLGKELNITEIFKAGDQVDTHAVTTGKGFQGPVKRFGVNLRHHKSEKTIRGPGSLGGWKAQGHVMYRVAHAGQMGYHLRTEYNKHIIKIMEKPEEVNRKPGFKRYGIIKNQCILVKGSVQGPVKRIIRLNFAMRSQKKLEAPEVSYLSKT